MILTRAAILDAVASGDIVLNPFDAACVGPNSVDLHLSADLLVYEPGMLDMAIDNPTRAITIPPAGLWLTPGVLYLGCTQEIAGSNRYIPFIEGRSSVARLGISVHASAGFGDLAFLGSWTLELSVVQPVRVYAGVRICQIAFVETSGLREAYAGKYQRQAGPTPSRLHREFTRTQEKP